MKTTIDIADDLLQRAKEIARRERRTLRNVVEDALRRFESEPTRSKGAFRLRVKPVRGRGLQNGLVEGDWNAVRDIIYRD